jgi:hypothetical protein
LPEGYAAHFELEGFLRPDCAVTATEPSGQGWDVTWRQGAADRREHFARVAIATGRFHRPLDRGRLERRPGARADAASRLARAFAALETDGLAELTPPDLGAATALLVEGSGEDPELDDARAALCVLER